MNRSERRSADKQSKPFDFRLALKVVTDDDYRAALLRRRNGTPAEPRMVEMNGQMVDMGKPRQPGWAEQLNDMLIQRQMPDFIMRSRPESLERYDRQIALLAWLVDDVDTKLEAGDKMRKNFEIPDDIMADFQKQLEDEPDADEDEEVA